MGTSRPRGINGFPQWWRKLGKVQVVRGECRTPHALPCGSGQRVRRLAAAQAVRHGAVGARGFGFASRSVFSRGRRLSTEWELSLLADKSFLSLSSPFC